MNKVVIPRTHVTIHYILLELEELAREELFRIKIIKKKKALMAAQEGKSDKKEYEICPICNKPVELIEDPKDKKRRVSKDHEHKAKATAKPPAVEASKPPPIQSPKLPPPPISPKPLPTPPPPKPLPMMPQVDSIKEIYRPPSSRTMGEPDYTQFLATAPSEDNKLEYLKKLLSEIIGLGKNMVTGGNKIDMEQFINICEEARDKIDKYIETEDTASVETDPKLKDRLEHLKLHLREVIDLTQNFRNETILTTSMEHFLETCEAVDERLDVYVKSVESKPIREDTKARLLHLKQQIKDVVEMTEDYKQQGLLTPSVEEFVKTCASVQIRIDEYTKDVPPNINADRINHLKDHVGQLEKLTTDIKREGLATSSLEKFMLSCNEFKTKLDEYKKKVKFPRSQHDGDMNKLVEQLDETIEMSMLAKKEGLIDESVDEFVQCCENIKKKLYENRKEEEEGPQTLSELKTNISGVIQLITDLKAEGLITESVEDFLKTCEMTKDRINVYERYPLREKQIASAPKGCTGQCTSTCTETCTCDADREEVEDEEPCDKCKELLNEPIEPVLPFAVEPCDSCRGIIRLEEPYPCESCEIPPVPEPPPPKLCKHCKKNINEEPFPEIHTPESPEPPETPPLQPPPVPPSPVDSSLGYFEKKIRKITRVTRSMNEDGTIREEKETIIIRKNRHDPTETEFADDDDDNDDDDFEDLPNDNDDDAKLCALCVNIDPYIGFRKTKSEGVIRVPSLIMPNLKQSISIDMKMFKDNSFSDYSFEIVTSVHSLYHFPFNTSFYRNQINS